jgi:hypothetical protein
MRAAATMKAFAETNRFRKVGISHLRTLAKVHPMSGYASAPMAAPSDSRSLRQPPWADRHIVKRSGLFVASVRRPRAARQVSPTRLAPRADRLAPQTVSRRVAGVSASGVGRSSGFAPTTRAASPGVQGQALGVVRRSSSASVAGARCPASVGP